MMADKDGHRTFAVLSLHKTAYHACNQTQRDMYNGWKLPPVDLQVCCTRLFDILKLSNDRHRFDPLGDRHGMLTKMRPLHVLFEIFENAATHGHYDCFRFAREIANVWLPRFDQQSCTNAAKAGHLDCLRYAHEIGCRWDSKTCAAAAASGHLNCLKYAYENGCHWDATTVTMATTFGRLHCLAYAQQRGCPN